MREITAVAKAKGVIEVNVPKEHCPFKLDKFRLYVNHKFTLSLESISDSESNSSIIYTIVCGTFNFIPGNEYEIATEQNFFIPVDITFLATTKEFEQKYRYDGTLGAIYSKEETTFNVFSPFSREITLHIKKPNEENFETYSMSHNMENGIFSVTIKGDYDGALYLYERYMFGKSIIICDPYSFSLGSNSRYSYVINPEKVRKIKTNSSYLPTFNDSIKAIIYECDVRDMTSLTTLKDKGTYKALSLSGLKTNNGNPIGLDYLASLGITHVQLLPVLDFQTIDDDNPNSMYNWGYDPLHYFSPEGSYATNPDDPYSRILELRGLVSALHKKSIRVVFDVVYNHVFSSQNNPLNVLCPNYYFRYDSNGVASRGCGCGNDIESRNYMVRKLILDSLNHALDFYDVDGFRFDLMGILDVDTINLAYKELSSKKKNIMLYGEGWDLWTALPSEQKATHYNAYQMPSISFFNDRFRDVVKGKTNESEISVRGYLLGDTNYRDGFKHVLLGSAIPLAFVPMFSSVSQSVNYVECHDNHTLYDKIKIACPGDSKEEIEKRIKMNLFTILIAAGIPFFHQGQEIGGTKQGLPNTYNAGDKLNGFDYSLLDKNISLYEYFKDAIKFKKECLYLNKKEYESMIAEKKIVFEDLEYGALKMTFIFNEKKIHIIFNPTYETLMYEFKDYVNLIFNENGFVITKQNDDFFIHMAIVNSLSINVFIEEKKKTKVSKEDIENA